MEVFLTIFQSFHDFKSESIAIDCISLGLMTEFTDSADFTTLYSFVDISWRTSVVTSMINGCHLLLENATYFLAKHGGSQKYSLFEAHPVSLFVLLEMQTFRVWQVISAEQSLYQTEL